MHEYQLSGWDGPYTGPAHGANAHALTARYTACGPLSRDRILEIGRSVAWCHEQSVSMKGVTPVQSLLYHLDNARRMLIVFPQHEELVQHPVYIYVYGQMTPGERNSHISSIVGGIIERLGKLSRADAGCSMLRSVT